MLSLALLCAAGCSGSGGAPRQATDTSADEATIRAATAAWIDAYNVGDVDKIVAFYAEDTVLMPANAPALKGRAAVRAFLVADMASARKAGLAYKDGPGDVGVAGDLAWHAGASLVVDAQGATVATGKYIEVWRRMDGRWLMVRDIWNDDAAPAAATGK
jgi:ketosteroid isomerase-like protein